MFKLNEKHENDRIISKRDCIRYSPSKLGTINTANSQIYINIPKKDIVLFLLKSYFDSKIGVLHATTNKRHADNIGIRLFNLGPIALFSIYMFTASSSKHLEDISHAHIVFLMFNLITSAGDTGKLTIGFDRDRGRRQRELTNNKA